VSAYWTPLSPDTQTVFTGYALEMWHDVKSYLWLPGDASLHVKFWVDGQCLGEFTAPEEAWMPGSAYVEIASLEGSVWFDDICISSATTCPFAKEDCDCNGVINIQDVVCTVNSAFRGEPTQPSCCLHK
jgi:hypothetical protein